ncbi:Nn.00g016530.m01.CDS01 [Neocucurbitaria sp. VM-36]
MVLQDIENSAPDSFTDNPYPSETDSYASPSSSPGVRFDPSSLPQPLPIIGTFMGFSDGAVRFKTETTLKFAERKLGRQLYPDESQALAYHIYQLEQTKSYYAAAGATAGTWRWYNTWDKMRYPFYQPKVEDINPNKFAFIRGPMAQFARHTWRFSLYVLVAGQMGNIIGQLIAQPLAAVNTSKDPKLEQFGIELKAAAHADGERNAQQGRGIQDRRREFQEQVRNREGGGPSPQARWGRQAPEPSEDARDDMSPTAGNGSWESRSTSSESWESFSNSTSQPTPQRQQGRLLPPRQSTQPSSLPFDDDASPTGGLFQDEVNNPQAPVQPQSRPGESTWDRLRRGGAPAPLQRPQQPPRRGEPERKEQQEGSKLDDTFTFVENDEERKRERARAQQEFDVRLERERQGKDFNSDEGKRW